MLDEADPRFIFPPPPSHFPAVLFFLLLLFRHLRICSFSLVALFLFFFLALRFSPSQLKDRIAYLPVFVIVAVVVVVSHLLGWSPILPFLPLFSPS